MIWNQNRLAYLSGMSDLHTYRKKALNEVANTSDLHNTGDDKVALIEARSRKVIREERKNILDDMEQAKIKKSLQTGNLSSAMGFAGYGFSKPSENRTHARTSTTVSFGGPGFM